jgi:hypothetical protein
MQILNLKIALVNFEQVACIVETDSKDTETKAVEIHLVNGQRIRSELPKGKTLSDFRIVSAQDTI